MSFFSDDAHLIELAQQYIAISAFSYFNEKVPASFHGTGDIFTATVLGGMMQGRSLEQAVALAVDLSLIHISAKAGTKVVQPVPPRSAASFSSERVNK